jgi:hypothetical protein
MDTWYSISIKTGVFAILDGSAIEGKLKVKGEGSIVTSIFTNRAFLNCLAWL